MENLFMYGVSGQDLNDCEDFLNGLESQANTAYEETRFIPSPQEMLSTGVDPYAGQYDQMFVLGDWDVPVGNPAPNAQQAPQQQPQQPQQPQQAPQPQMPPCGPASSGHAAPPTMRQTLARSPPVKSESPSDEYNEFQPDAPDIGLDSGGLTKRRARKTKTSHNMIEKRYRNNINDKINLLRDAVPGLRDAATTTIVDGIPSIRLNKATVLTKAAEYIEQLKSRNSLLLRENSELRAKVTRRYQYPPQNVAPQGGPTYVHAPGGPHGAPTHPNSNGGASHSASHAPPGPSGPHAPAARNPSGPAPQHYLPQQPRPHINTNIALGCATAGLVATGSVLSSGDSQFRGLSVLPFPQLAWLLNPSSSAVKFFFVAATCFVIGALWVSILQNWSPKSKEHAEVLTSHHHHRLSARENALYRLGWPQHGTTAFYASKFASLLLQSVLALGLGSDRLAHLKGLVGLGGNEAHSLYAFQLIDTDLTGTTKVHWAHHVCTFMLAIVYPSPNSRMLQAVQIRQLSAKLNNMRSLNKLADELWKYCEGPDYLKALSRTPLSEIVSQQHTHITITAHGVKVSDFVALNTADPKILSTLDLVACLHAYGLQDRTLLRVLESGSPDMDLFSESAVVAPPQTYAALRSKGMRMLLTDEKAKFASVFAQVRDQVAGRSVQMSFPRLVACAFTKWLADDEPQFAEQILAAQSGSISDAHSSIVFLAYYMALKCLHERQLGRSNLVPVTLELRQWLGSQASHHFGLSTRRRKELIAETLEFAQSFAARESDEACEIDSEAESLLAV